MLATSGPVAPEQVRTERQKVPERVVQPEKKCPPKLSAMFFEKHRPYTLIDCDYEQANLVVRRSQALDDEYYSDYSSSSFDEGADVSFSSSDLSSNALALSQKQQSSSSASEGRSSSSSSESSSILSSLEDFQLPNKNKWPYVFTGKVCLEKVDFSTTS